MVLRRAVATDSLSRPVAILDALLTGNTTDVGEFAWSDTEEKVGYEEHGINSDALGASRVPS